MMLCELVAFVYILEWMFSSKSFMQSVTWQAHISLSVTCL